MLCDHDAILLRPWCHADAVWYVHARDAEVFRWTTERPELSVQEAQSAIAEVNRREDVCAFAITDARSHVLLGSIAVVQDATSPRVAEVMYWLAPSGRGRGAATRAVQRVVRWAFDTRPIDHMFLRTHPQNSASQRVAERAGFHLIETPQHTHHAADTHWFRISRTT